MPTTKAAKKSLRQIKTRTARNIKRKNAVKELMKKVRLAMNSGDNEKVKALLPKVQKAFDKAVKVGVIKANTANRKKSRLAARIKKAGKK